VITRNAAHQYTYEGVQYPGVTSIIDMAGASFDQAARYGAKQAAEHVYGLMRTPDAIAAMYANLGQQGFVAGIANAARQHVDKARQVGSDVHELADKVINGQSPTIPQNLAAHVMHYRRWWEGELAAGSKLRLAEAMVIRPRADDFPYGWGGTFDLLYYDRDGCTVMADLKTGNLYSKVYLQLAGYSMATRVQPAEVTLTPARDYPMPKVDKYKVIHVTAEECRPIEIDVTTAERMAFLACLDLYHWMESMKGKRL
jgi:hypothetical protein